MLSQPITHSNMIKLLKQFVLLSAMICNSVQAEYISLTADELDYISANPTVRVHNEFDWTPFNFNEDGEPKGYSIEYMNLVGEKLGLKVEYVSGPSWGDFLVMMRDKTLDLMVNIASTAERRTYLAFTEPYLITYVSLFVHNSENHISDLDDLVGKKIAFTEGFFFGEFIRKYYPKIEIVTFESTLASFIAVEKGLADAAIEVPVVGQRILLNAKMNSLKQGGKVSDPRFITTFSIAAHKDNQILKRIIQKGMDNITSTEENLIRKKWKIEDTKKPLITEHEETGLQALLWPLLIGIVLIVLYTIYRFQQGARITAKLITAHKEVEDANQELKQQARTDVLTGISNRLSTEEALFCEQNRFERYGEIYSVILLDIDHFKQVNDNHGHQTGDEVLKLIAKILDKNTRENDHPGRWGGKNS